MNNLNKIEEFIDNCFNESKKVIENHYFETAKKIKSENYKCNISLCNTRENNILEKRLYINDNWEFTSKDLKFTIEISSNSIIINGILLGNDSDLGEYYELVKLETLEIPENTNKEPYFYKIKEFITESQKRCLKPLYVQIPENIINSFFDVFEKLNTKIKKIIPDLIFNKEIYNFYYPHQQIEASFKTSFHNCIEITLFIRRNVNSTIQISSGLFFQQDKILCLSDIEICIKEDFYDYSNEFEVIINFIYSCEEKIIYHLTQKKISECK